MMKSEYVSRDILEESYLKMFSPFRVIQFVLGSCRVDANNRFVTSPTKGQKIYTIFYLLSLLSLHVFYYFNYIVRLYPYPIAYYVNVIAIFINYGTFACSIIHVRFINNDMNVKFYLKMQDIDRKLKIEKIKVVNDFIYKANLITFIVVLFILFLIFGAVITADSHLFVYLMGPLLAELTSTIECLFGANLLIYFYLRLSYINAIMLNYIKGTTDINIKKVRNKSIPTMKVLRYLASKTHDFQYSDVDVYLKNILEELLRFQYLYRFQVRIKIIKN